MSIRTQDYASFEIDIRDSGKLESWIKSFKSLIVRTAEDLDFNKTIYKKAKKAQNEIEENRKKKTEPLRMEIAKINDEARKHSDPINMIITMTNEKTSQYIELTENRRKAEEELLAKEAAFLGVAQQVYLDPVKKISGGDAIVTQKVETKFRVIDESKIPREYLVVDEKAISKAIKLGIINIEGIEIYEETKTQMRTR